MKRLIVPILLCCISIFYGNAKETDSVSWEKAECVMKNKEYQQACSLYQELYYNHALEDYRKINTVDVDDLRKKYSIDELELKNNIEKNRLLNFLWIAGFFFVAAIILLIFYLKHQHKRIVHSKKEKEKAKAFAEESIKNKSLLLSNMSHEIRTPLNALAGFSELLAMDELDDETRAQSNEVIRMNSDLLLKLINDVVNITCTDVKNMLFHIQPCEVISIGRSVVSTVAAIKRTQASIAFESDLKELVIDTDSDRLQQMLINLMVNATKFTKEGCITLKIELADENRVQFSVTDTGCGIPLKFQSQIFGRFEKLHEQVQGSGIGLSICQIIINRLGGKIWVDSTYTIGARFTFIHPLKQ